MKKSLPTALLFALLLSACHSLQKKEQLLSDAGFHSVTPTTAAQTAHLKSLQAQTKGHLTPVRKHGQTFFLLADAKGNRLFIGNQSDYQAYKQLRLSRQLSEDKAATTDLNADSTVEWDAWGGLDSPLWNSNY
jgi:hypothetical protein